MRDENIGEFILSVIMNASQLAFVEGAEGTYALLENLYVLYRHITERRETCLLGTEMEMVKNYLRLKCIASEKIDLQITNKMIPRDYEIKRMSLLGMIENLTNNKPKELDDIDSITLTFNTENSVTVEAGFQSGSSEVRIKKDLS